MVAMTSVVVSWKLEEDSVKLNKKCDSICVMNLIYLLEETSLEISYGIYFW